MTGTSLRWRHPAFAGEIGIARRDITPPQGIYARNWGASIHDVAGSLHRPLLATSVALRSAAGSRAVLVALDLGWWSSAQDEAALRHALAERLGIGEDALVVNLSHTHSGPAISSALRDRPGGELIAPYLGDVLEAAAQSAREALDGARPAVLEFTTGRCDLARNRDLSGPNGALCGFNPGGQADDAVLVGRISTAGGEQIGTVVNYACHPTSLGPANRAISPDYVGAMRETVEQATAAPCVFLQGCSGELGPLLQYSEDPAVADRNGRALGHCVLGALELMLAPSTELRYRGALQSGAALGLWGLEEVQPPEALRTTRAEVLLELKATLRPSRAIAADLETCTDRVLAERLRREAAVRSVVGEGTQAAMPIWVWRAGRVFVVGVPAEAYSQLQVTLRQAFPEDAVVVMNLANGGFIGYLPDAEAYGRPEAYQVVQTPAAEGSLERTVAACSETMKSIAW